MRKLVDNRPRKVRCPHCGKFMIPPMIINEDVRTLKFYHYCIKGRVVESVFSACYIRKAKSYGLHWVRRDSYDRLNDKGESYAPSTPKIKINNDPGYLTEAVSQAIKQWSDVDQACTFLQSLNVTQDLNSGTVITSCFQTIVR